MPKANGKSIAHPRHACQPNPAQTVLGMPSTGLLTRGGTAKCIYSPDQSPKIETTPFVDSIVSTTWDLQPPPKQNGRGGGRASVYTCLASSKKSEVFIWFPLSLEPTARPPARASHLSAGHKGFQGFHPHTSPQICELIGAELHKPNARQVDALRIPKPEPQKPGRTDRTDRADRSEWHRAAARPASSPVKASREARHARQATAPRELQPTTHETLRSLERPERLGKSRVPGSGAPAFWGQDPRKRQTFIQHGGVALCPRQATN